MSRVEDGTEAGPPAMRGTTLFQQAAVFFEGKGAAAVLLMLATLPYVGILRNDFVYTYDDKVLILDNPYVHNVHHLQALLTSTLFSNLGVQTRLPYFRPMANLSFLLCYQLFGPSAYGFHLFSLMLNAAVVGILFLVAKRLQGNHGAALSTVGLFALHPVHVEAVAWISAVTDIEVTLFCLLAFWCFLKAGDSAEGRNMWALVVMTGSFALAILSKEQAMTLPLLATIYEHFYRGDRSKIAIGRKILRYGPLWLVSVGYVLFRIRIMGAFAHTTGVNPIAMPTMLFSALALVGQYLGKLFWPLRLSAFHPFRASASLFEIPVLAGVCALVLCGCLLYVLWKRARPASFGILWLFVTLLPVLNARWMSAYVLGERYLYLPSVGFCLVAGWACALLWQISSHRGSMRISLAVAGCVVASLCVLRIGLRVLDWQDDVTLYLQSLAAEPNDYRLHDALGSAYWVRGNSAGAEREWRESLRLEPNNVGPLRSLGTLYAQEKRFNQALPLLEEVLRLDPNDADGHLNLGAAYAETGSLDRAEVQFRTAVLLSPMNVQAHNVLGKLYFDSNRLAEAEQQFRQSLECEPNLAAYDHLGYIYMRRGDHARAEEAFKAALAMKGTDSHAHFNLGLIYSATGRNIQAVEELKAALTTDPHNPEILSALEKLQH